MRLIRITRRVLRPLDGTAAAVCWADCANRGEILGLEGWIQHPSKHIIEIYMEEERHRKSSLL